MAPTSKHATTKTYCSHTKLIDTEVKMYGNIYMAENSLSTTAMLWNNTLLILQGHCILQKEGII